jgi:hypothetical protein
VSALWHVGAKKTKAFVDFQHDVTDADVELAAREGFVSIEHLKRYTTLGMATDQGKTEPAERSCAARSRDGQVDRRGRHDPVTAAISAGRHRRACGPPSR